MSSRKVGVCLFDEYLSHLITITQNPANFSLPWHKHEDITSISSRHGNYCKLPPLQVPVIKFLYHTWLAPYVAFEFFTVCTKVAEMVILYSKDLTTAKKSYLQWGSTLCKRLLNSNSTSSGKETQGFTILTILACSPVRRFTYLKLPRSSPVNFHKSYMLTQLGMHFQISHCSGKQPFHLHVTLGLTTVLFIYFINRKTIIKECNKRLQSELIYCW